MSDREGLLSAIAADPVDDVPRLVLADWLEERGDPLGEFIRLQMALEPLRVPCADPAAELERNKRLRGIPPGKDWPDDGWPVKQQHDREWDLLYDHRAAWMGEAAEVEEPYHNHFTPAFRRGFVASAGIALSTLLRDGRRVRQGCPFLQELAVFGNLGRGKDLAGCAALAGLPALSLGWLDAEDANALAGSPNLAAVRSLTAWLGEGDDDEGMLRGLSRLPGLRKLRLVQMWGGIDVDDAEGRDRRADELVQAARNLRRDWNVTLERPFARRFPLDGRNVGRRLNGGHLPDGQAVLLFEGRHPTVMYFDDEGWFVREEQLDYNEKLSWPPPPPYQHSPEFQFYEEELFALLGKEIGFRPGPVFVREFGSQLCEACIAPYWNHQDEMYRAGTDAAEAERADASLHHWWTTGQFQLPYWNDYTADGLGRIHSS